jgi:hypothetical protein
MPNEKVRELVCEGEKGQHVLGGMSSEFFLCVRDFLWQVHDLNRGLQVPNGRIRP